MRQANQDSRHKKGDNNKHTHRHSQPSAVRISVCVVDSQNALTQLMIFYTITIYANEAREREKEGDCSALSYQQISKRASSQRLIIPPSSASTPSGKLNLAENHEEFEIRILFVVFSSASSSARIICQRDAEYD